MKKFALPGAALGFLLVLGAIIAASPTKTLGQVPIPYQTGTFTSATSPPVILSMTGGQNSATYHQVGTPGPIDVYGSNDGTHFTLLNIYSAGGTLLASNTGTPAFPYTGSSGVDYTIWPVHFAFVYIEPDTSWSGQSSAILARASAAIAILPGGAGGGGSAGPCPTQGANMSISGTTMPNCAFSALSLWERG